MHQIHAGCVRHIRKSDANVARACRARSAQQGILHLDPSVSGMGGRIDTSTIPMPDSWNLQILSYGHSKTGIRHL
jgi:hypothetical protein